MPTIDLKTEDGIRAEREVRFKQAEGERTARLEIELCDALLKQKKEELDALVKQMQEIRGERRQWERQHAAAVSAREFLRNHKPPWVDEQLRWLNEQRLKLMADSEQRRLRVEYLAEQVQLAGRMGRPPQELLDKLDAAREELEPHTHQLAAIAAEQGALIELCLHDPWPKDDVLTPQDDADQPELAVAEPAGARRRVTPPRSN